MRNIGAVIADGEFQPSDWELQIIEDTGGHSRIDAVPSAAGGHPGSYLTVSIKLPTLTDSLRVFHCARRTINAPQDGAIYAVDFAANRALPLSWDVPAAGVLQALFQGGRRYRSRSFSGYPGWPTGDGDLWQQAFNRSSLVADDFQLAAGPPCAAGERCPDFSPSGLPITFGFVALASNHGEQLVWRGWLGLDKWRVTRLRKSP